MKNCLKKKKTLFDGDQDQFVLEVWKINCGNCGQIVQFGVSECQSFMNLDSDLKKSVLSEVKNIDAKIFGNTAFYKADGLPISFFQKNCSNCGKCNLGILGLGEYQPARYMVVMVGLMVSDL